MPVGTTVSYGYDVTNTGTSPIPSDDVLDQVVLLDTASPPQPSWVSPTYTGGDDEGNGMLDRVWTYECSAAANVDTTNIAGVTAIGGSTLDPPLAVQVFSLAGAFVGVFDPGIAITKTADPMFLIGGGDVTYTSEVTNTGDVALTNVAAAIGDNTCSSVTYVSGDIDNDGLLDTPNSIFEDSADETRIFTCAASVTQTTTNVVDVSGTPVDAGGTDLCASESPRIASGCDVTTQAKAVVEGPNPVRSSSPNRRRRRPIRRSNSRPRCRRLLVEERRIGDLCEPRSWYVHRDRAGRRQLEYPVDRLHRPKRQLRGRSVDRRHDDRSRCG